MDLYGNANELSKIHPFIKGITDTIYIILSKDQSVEISTDFFLANKWTNNYFWHSTI